MLKPEPISTFQVNKSKPKKFRESAIYNTLLNLLTTDASNFSTVSVQHDHTSDKPVFYLRFNKPPVNPLFSGVYKDIESHLTVHRSFKDSSNPFIMNGLSLAHYTETYFDPTNNKKIVAHVYLNREANILHIQVKEHVGGSVTEIRISGELEKRLIENAIPAAELARELIASSEVYYQSALLRATICEEKLEELSQQISEESYADYIKVGANFIAEIEICSRYSLSGYDNRGKIVAQQIRNLKQRIYKVIDSTVSKDEEESEKEGSVSADIHNEPESNSDANFNNEFEEIKILNGSLENIIRNLKLEPHEITLLIEQMKLVDELRFKLLLMSSNLALLDKEQRTVLQKIKDNVKNNPDLLKLFLKEFWLGSVEAVKKLYPYIKTQLNVKIFVDELLVPLMSIKPNSLVEEQKINFLIDFLYKESVIFRQILTGQAIIFLELKNSDLFVALLVYACISENIFVFRTLLAYGQSPNRTGALIGGLQVPAIYLIACLDKEVAEGSFLKTAFEFGAFYKCSARQLPHNSKGARYHIGAEKISEPIKTVLGLRHSSETTQDTKTQFSRYTTLIDACDDFKNYKAIALFVPQLKLIDQLLLLSRLSLEEGIYKRHIIPCSNPEIKAVINFAEIDNVTMQMKSQKGPAEHFSLLLFFEDEPTIKLVAELLDNISKNIAQMRESSPALLNEIYDELLRTAKLYQKISSNNPEILYHFEACLWLLYYEKPRSFMNYQKILQIYCHMAASISKKPGRDNQENAQLYYTIARQLAQGTVFAAQLNETPLYKHIVAKLAESTLPAARTQWSP